ncbi:hypothetical protein RclHR1_04570012 [Rhizophagus clarus]|uniref:Uncharacterized protein n=1 Tax=Rhizophagus clarus TaxID=94130 RepID=A0A2Z6RVJ4_9GLOM|nr:hypothetical protein RclHR1_04570012 [Rhizophagus clarus]GES87002.1 hypothetical protein GLOIN_2v1484247 [Rhizophagus clarus]
MMNYQCQCECHYYHILHLLSQISSPQNTLAPYENNTNRRTRTLKINFIICIDGASTIIPKIGSSHWDYLKSRNLIKENVEIPINSSSTEINSIISNFFPDHRKRWSLYNSSNCTLRKVPCDEITYDLIKQNLTKTKKLYIAPSAIDTSYVPEDFEIADPFNLFNISNSFDVPEVSDVANAFEVPMPNFPF